MSCAETAQPQPEGSVSGGYQHNGCVPCPKSDLRQLAPELTKLDVPTCWIKLPFGMLSIRYSIFEFYSTCTQYGQDALQPSFRVRHAASDRSGTGRAGFNSLIRRIAVRIHPPQSSLPICHHGPPIVCYTSHDYVSCHPPLLDVQCL